MAHEIEMGQDGFYTICVFHAEMVPEDEIKDVFGEFGYIVKINRLNGKTFIRYKTLEEAILCYESMQGDDRFNVKPGKRKAGTNNIGRNRDGQVGEMNRGDNFRGRRSEMGGSGDFGRPTFTGAAKRAPPKLIPFPSIDLKEDGAEAKTVPSAKVVVMANLNPKMGQSNVYNLCTKAQAPPLHVAMKSLKRPPYPNISYAFVYVRDEEEVENIITSFNNLILNGYKMVASSVENLSEEGKALLSAK